MAPRIRERQLLDRQKIAWQTLRIVLPNFQYALPECQAFLRSVMHQTTVALLKMLLLLPTSRVEGSRVYEKALTTQEDYPTRLYFDNHPNPSLRGKTKGTEDIQVLREHSLWPDGGWRSDCFMVSSSAHKSDAKAGLLLPMSVAAIPRWAVLAAVQLSAGIHLMA